MNWLKNNIQYLMGAFVLGLVPTLFVVIQVNHRWFHFNSPIMFTVTLLAMFMVSLCTTCSVWCVAQLLNQHE